MDTTGLDLTYTERAPLIIGDADGSAPVLVTASGYGEGWRLGQVGYVSGTGVEDELNRPQPLLHRLEDGDTVDGSDALLERGAVRTPQYVPELGIQARAGTSADSQAIVASVDPDPPTGLREPSGPASIHDEQSDRRPAARRRTTDQPTFDSAALVPDDDGTYDLDSDDEPAPKRTRRARSGD